jgi:hypothetical protein
MSDPNAVYGGSATLSGDTLTFDENGSDGTNSFDTKATCSRK